jgi:hypothetical protein
MAELVGALSRGIRWWRSRRRPWLDRSIWLATEDEQRAIGGPLGRIAVRRAPVGTLASDDVVDGISAALATTKYALDHGQAEDEADAAAAVAVGFGPGGEAFATAQHPGPAGPDDDQAPAPAGAPTIAGMLR